MKTKFTPDQTKAIEQLGNVIVSAGAGSGKTAVLSERVLFNIKERGYKIQEFLILTFTRLAAGEMKDRIRKKLKDEGLDDANYVDNADITTFDSFANALVKKYHTYLNLDESFTLVESNIIQVYIRKKIEEEINKLFYEQNETFLEFYDLFCLKDENNFIDLVLQFLKVADLQIDKERYYQDFILNYCNETIYQQAMSKVFEDFKEKIAGLLNYVDLVPALPRNGGTLAEEYYQVIAEVCNSSSYDELLEKSKNFKAPRFLNGEKGNLDEAELADKAIFDKMIERTIKAFAKYPTKKEAINILKEQEKLIRFVCDFAKRIDDLQMQYKYQQQAFEFMDVNKFAIELVRDFEDVREEVKNKYKIIMIDEYQDTNEIQEVFMSYIQNNNVYCVGDIKQSIYAFRNAKCEIFQKKYDDYKLNKGGVAIDLNMNFRSRKEVLDNINKIFIELMTSRYGGANYKKDHIIDYGNKAYLDEINESQDNNLEIYKYQGNDEKEIRIIANDIINKINSKYQVMEPNKDKPWNLRDCEFKDFAIIIDRGSQFEDYIRIFNEYQIPLFVERNEGIKSNEIVLVLKNVLTIIDYLSKKRELDIDFKRAFVSIARSFLFAYDDQKIYQIVTNNLFLQDPISEMFKTVLANNLGASDYILLYETINELDFYLKLSRIGNIENNHVYLDYFLDTFKQMSELGFHLSDFILYLDNLNEYGLDLTIASRGSKSNAVRLINIHKSKGLEFNIIYFSGLKKGFVKTDVKNPLGVSQKYGMYLDGSNISLIKKAHLVDYKNDLISEKIRLFYVALTRAREKMILLLPEVDKYREKEINDADSVYDLIYPYINKFNVVDKSKYQEQKLNIVRQKVDSSAFDLKIVEFNRILKFNATRASKESSFGVNKDALNFGEELHFALEAIDFKNPDYSFIKSKHIKEKIMKFLSSDLLNDINNAKIYKEYEFIDKVNNHRGIIDLFMVYKDKVVIIDYKTKNIDDENYDLQLKVYYDFLSQKYQLPIKMYLYSIIEEKYREVSI